MKRERGDQGKPCTSWMDQAGHEKKLATRQTYLWPTVQKTDPSHDGMCGLTSTRELGTDQCLINFHFESNSCTMREASVAGACDETPSQHWLMKRYV